ncbi:MAG: hypothetical protein OEX12_13405 [Gammaproteobacteria bacterium]|nr:hypothetical protein [Gammaproteobacteria bacterium]
MTALTLLVSTFALVFFLGLQSLVVNGGHRVMAFFNSLAIGTANLALFKLAPEASGIEIAAYLSGGPLGIVSAMIFFKWWKARHIRNKAQVQGGV